MQRPGFQVAQVNIALARAPIDSEVLSEFVAQLDPINALAEAAPGFVWRLQQKTETRWRYAASTTTG
jgi:hypothetical protein